MKIVIAGGSGQIGQILAREFLSKGHQLIILSRAKKQAANTLFWDGQTVGPWAKELEGADVLINLTGKSVNCRYTPKNRCEIWSSRVRSVRLLADVVKRLSRPPKLWIQAGTATIYAHTFDSPNDEVTGNVSGYAADAPDTWRFSIDVASSWEGEFSQIELPHTRKVLLRSAMTMSPDRDGIFDYLLWLVRSGLGGKSGDGKQFVSWIHHKDFIRAIYWLIEREDISGAINICAPSPLPNQVFMQTLRNSWGVSLGFPATRLMLEIGAVFLRTETELVLKSRRVVPKRLLDSGFTFNFPAWESAAADLCADWRNTRGLTSKKVVAA